MQILKRNGQVVLEVEVITRPEVEKNLRQKRATSVFNLDRYKFAIDPWTDSNLYYKYRDTI